MCGAAARGGTRQLTTRATMLVLGPTTWRESAGGDWVVRAADSGGTPGSLAPGFSRQPGSASAAIELPGEDCRLNIGHRGRGMGPAFARRSIRGTGSAIT